ncbi:MAG: ABC transporter permease [Spirochaetaceae bacterium]|nr:ABC transporter permease [Spirochaetaceae bacterium]
MLEFIVRRSITLIPILVLISVVSFVIIELPPGDWIDVRLATLRDSGIELDEEEADRLEALYGFNRPVHERYLRWMQGIVVDFNFGWSFQWARPVNDLLAERLPLTLLISLLSLVVSWLIAIPIGIYSATHQYSTPDYAFTFFGFLGLAIPGFLLALVMAWVLFRFFGFSSSGLYDISFVGEPMSWPKFVSILQHLILPLLIIGLAGTGATIRIMRGNLLDELKRQYVVTARSKGVAELRLLFKYPVRLAMNPVLSTIGWVLPAIFSGEVLVSLVLGLQTTGPLLLRAVLAQDMFLAGSIVLILSTLTVIGTLVSDILLAWLDPRIRYGAVGR